MKKISVLIPCYNEVENAGPISKAVTDILEKELPQYDYELVFIDNDSTDGTRDVIRGLCKENPRIKAIFNARNFGQFNSPYYGMLQVTGDCVIEMVADFQDPVEMIPKYVHESALRPVARKISLCTGCAPATTRPLRKCLM